MYRHWSYSLINILGLAVGLASAIVIGLWVYQEWSYDRHFEGSDRIYRVSVNFMNIGDMAVGPPQLNDYLRKFPEVEKTGRLDGVSSLDIHVGDKIFNQPNVYYADSTLFEVFSYNFIEGERNSALDQPRQAVLTKETASKFFGSRSAMGEIILVGDEKEPYVVVGVADTRGHRSHINASMWLTYRYSNNTNWRSASVYNYVKLRAAASRQAFEERLQEFIKHEIYPTLSINTPFEEWIQTEGAYRFITMPITDIYLKSDLKFEPTPGGSENNVKAFFAIALLIIVIAAVNFINITTARSSIRAKEVGIRKTLGTGRGALIAQFLFESVLLSAIALVVSFGLGELFLSFFEQFTGMTLLDGLFANSWQQIAVVSAIALGIGLLAGIYPALYLTRFKPVKVLKGQLHSGTGDQSLFRSGLVLLQFTISICLLIGTGVIYQQLQYMRTKDLGLNKENVFVIENVSELGDQKEAFRQQLLQHNGVQTASYNERIPAGSSVLVSMMKSRHMEEDLPMQSFAGDYEMIPTLGFRVLKGRNFSKEVAADTHAVLLNESAVKALGLKEPIGARLNDKYTVIGLVGDFNYENLRRNIEPTVVEFSEEGDRLAVKLAGDQKQEFIDYAKSTWDQFGPEAPMNYYFLDQNFEKLLAKDRVLAKAVVIFALLAIIISCLGLYGLSTFIAEQRTKEIGIRRVLGASAPQIIVLLNKSLTKPILVSIVIAIPLSFTILSSWLDNFAYKTEMSPWVFAAAGFVALLMAWVTVSWQSIRAAFANPAKTLRTE